MSVRFTESRRKAWLLAFALAVSACSGSDGLEPRVGQFSFSPIAAGDTLTNSSGGDVDAIIGAAIDSIQGVGTSMAIAIVDRSGRVLRIWNQRIGAVAGDDDNCIAVSLARTTAFLSHSQAPLTSRTGRFLNTFHFPSTFDESLFVPFPDPLDEYPCDPAPATPNTGVAKTPLAPLYEIAFSNRGADLGVPEVPPLLNPDRTSPSPGLTALPGAVPLYKTTAAGISSPTTDTVNKRLVGGIGVYITDNPDGSGSPIPAAGEFAAIAGASAARADGMSDEDYFFPVPIPREGAVYLVGVLLPALGPRGMPPGFVPGPGTGYDSGLEVLSSGSNGSAVPESQYLTGPTAGSILTAAEVDELTLACRDAALRTHAAIRLPADAPCQMIIAITDVDGDVLSAFRMADATLFSLEISITKARNAYYYSNPASRDVGGPNDGLHPLTSVFADQASALSVLNTTGIAVTARSLGFLAAEFYPPTIDGLPPGPLVFLRDQNRRGSAFDRMGFAPPGPNQSGIIFFPGSAPLYRNGVLAGGLGVSGDGVDQDDYVTDLGLRLAEQRLGMRLQPPEEIRSDRFSFRGVTIPYFKFPQNPGG